VARAKKAPTDAPTDAEKLAAISGIVNDPEIRRRRVQRESFDKIRRVIAGEDEPEITVAPVEAPPDEPDVVEDEAADEPEARDASTGAEGSRDW
jgi:hypothetical protein